MSEELAKGESWTLARLAEEGEEDRIILRLDTVYGPIEIETFYYCDSRAWVSWKIKRRYRQLQQKESV